MKLVCAEEYGCDMLKTRVDTIYQKSGVNNLLKHPSQPVNIPPPTSVGDCLRLVDKLTQISIHKEILHSINVSVIPVLLPYPPKPSDQGLPGLEFFINLFVDSLILTGQQNSMCSPVPSTKPTTWGIWFPNPSRLEITFPVHK